MGASREDRCRLYSRSELGRKFATFVQHSPKRRRFERGPFRSATRLVVIEDTPEIRAPFANSMAIRTADRVTMDRLLVSALRLAPQRIIVGEVREGAVLMTLLKAWNTGHPGGLVTLHANGADEVMARLAMLATEVTSTDQTPFISWTPLKTVHFGM